MSSIRNSLQHNGFESVVPSSQVTKKIRIKMIIVKMSIGINVHLYYLLRPFIV